MDREQLYAMMDQSATDFEKMSDAIWDFAELRFEEHKAAECQAEYLRSRGFDVTVGVGKLATAVVAEFGSGSPVIGIMGEYDALPGLSQEADALEKCPIEGKACGQGCGHHLLGTAAVEAACAVKTLIECGDIQGTIRYYGTPAEEGGGGKIHMIRYGCFDDLDVAISWHPSPNDTQIITQTLACIMFHVAFKGVAAHAAVAPDKGRSALDAAELMNIGVQFLREHIPDGSRIHYGFKDAGGSGSGNVVPDSAKLLYCVRGKTDVIALDLFERVRRIAQGAALMTDTELTEYKVVGSYGGMLLNRPLADAAYEELTHLIPIPFTQEEIDYANQYNRVNGAKENGYSVTLRTVDNALPFGSTDFADVSCVIPSVCLDVTTFAYGTSLHSWPVTAQGKSAGAKRGMHTAAKAMAGIAVRLCEDPELLAAAKADFAKSTEGYTYQSLLPEL
ncbi:MAG: amidohydrolase [Mogibacterium sp.]|nr:amidohydrolase [Mogibacterium sp.]